jgi:thiol-disulfide isomerase/thioredoxin
MIKYIFQFLAIAGILFFQKAEGQASREDTTRIHYQRLLASADPADKAALETALYELLKSNKETDWYTASNFFYQLKKVPVSDSIQKAQRIKFPLGMAVRADEAKVIFDEKDAVKKEVLYKAWMQKFPPEKLGPDRIQYDYVRNDIARAYAELDNVKKALEYANMTETPAWKGEGWAGPAYVLSQKGHVKEAIELLKKAAANSYKFMTTNKNDPGANFAASGYVFYNSSLADLLYQQKNYAEALQYIRAAHDSSKTVRGNVNSTYADVLIALNRDKEAFDIIDEAVREGQGTVQMKENMKKLYAKVKGSNEGYDAYMNSLNKILAEKIKKDMARQMISQPAPSFVLNDLDGHTVSLESLKGKTVILDFWATWCGPCKRSFPAMQSAVTRYKDDPNVVFLFIHTWERGDSAATENARKYIQEKKYPFEVLMDLQDATTGINKVVESYKVTGIPTKFVIDGSGNIRFRFTGFSGGEDAAVEEVSAMIELARNNKK